MNLNVATFNIKSYGPKKILSVPLTHNTHWQNCRIITVNTTRISKDKAKNPRLFEVIHLEIVGTMCSYNKVLYYRWRMFLSPIPWYSNKGSSFFYSLQLLVLITWCLSFSRAPFVTSKDSTGIFFPKIMKNLFPNHKFVVLMNYLRPVTVDIRLQRVWWLQRLNNNDLFTFWKSQLISDQLIYSFASVSLLKMLKCI